VDETYVKVAAVWRYVYRAVDQYGQVIDVYVSKRRNIGAARKFFTDVLKAHGRPTEIASDLAAPLLRVVDELFPDAVHIPGSERPRPSQSEVETDARAANRSDRGGRDRGHAFIQNLRRGHYDLGVEARNKHLRLDAAFEELAEAI